MILNLKAGDLKYENNRTLEISVEGFRGDPSCVVPIQVYIEVYEGKLRVHVWDGSSQDPQSLVIDPLD